MADWLIPQIASVEATSEDIRLAVEWLAINDVKRGGRNDPFERIWSLIG